MFEKSIEHMWAYHLLLIVTGGFIASSTISWWFKDRVVSVVLALLALSTCGQHATERIQHNRMTASFMTLDAQQWLYIDRTMAWTVAVSIVWRAQRKLYCAEMFQLAFSLSLCVACDLWLKKDVGVVYVFVHSLWHLLVAHFLFFYPLRKPDQLFLTSRKDNHVSN